MILSLKVEIETMSKIRQALDKVRVSPASSSFKATQQTFTCSNSITETLEKGTKYVQN